MMIEADVLLKLMGRISNIRNYQDKKVSQLDIEYLCEAFSLGFSSISNQARELLFINDVTTRESIVSSTLDPYMTESSAGAQSWLIDSPLVAVIVIEQRRAIARVGEFGKIIAEQEAESALQNMRLQAINLNIGTAVIRELDVDVLREELDLPWYVKPMIIFTAGYFIEEKDASPKLPINQIIHKERWE